MTRDLRDPRAIGLIYLKMRQLGADIADAVLMPAQNYWDGKWMSSIPQEHHMHEFFTNLPEGTDLSE